MDTLQRKVVWLVVSRAAILAAVVLLTLLLGRSSQYVWPVTILAFIVFALSLIYAAAMRLRLSMKVLIPLQFANDLLLVTWLVYRTGDVESPFNALYLVIVFAASLLTSRRGILVTTLLVLLSAGLMGLATANGWVHRADGTGYETSAIPELNLNLSYTLIAIAGVAVLSSHLADRQRRSDTALALTARNLADLRAFNERVIESMRSGLMTAGLDGRVTMCNRAAEEIMGRQTNELIGHPIGELFGDVAAAYLEEARENRAPAVLRSEVKIDLPDGSVAHLGFNIAPLTSEDGEVSGAVLIFQDLTDVVQLEEEFRRREKLAALGTMAAGLAHEIRNPLTSIRGSVQVLTGEMSATDDSRRLLDIILRESDRLNRTVTDFLAYARPAPHAPTFFDIRHEVADAIALLANSDDVGPRHEIVSELPDGEVIFYGDQNQLRQVFWNLCRNGLQAMPEGGVLTVTLAPVQGGGVQLAVGDTGVGMSAQQKDQLFLPFSSTKVGGTGLGMATVYQFVKDHDGRIEVVSDVGVGTRIVLHLPGRSTSAAELPLTGPRVHAAISADTDAATKPARS